MNVENTNEGFQPWDECEDMKKIKSFCGSDFKSLKIAQKKGIFNRSIERHNIFCEK